QPQGGGGQQTGNQTGGQQQQPQGGGGQQVGNQTGGQGQQQGSQGNASGNPLAEIGKKIGELFSGNNTSK
ncbi:MAG TPA: hypothetical protein VFP49_01320, partial [Nitrososphaeraceae archaeon]|nr:hypothetical protein [Nitrososphaeraceae archaeon]